MFSKIKEVTIPFVTLLSFVSLVSFPILFIYKKKQINFTEQFKIKKKLTLNPLAAAKNKKKLIMELIIKKKLSYK